MRNWEEMVEKMNNPVQEITILLGGKYVDLADAYISVSEAINHAAISKRVKVSIKKS